MLYDSLKTQIKNIPPAELAARGVITPARTNANGEKTYICPICGNGSGNSGDGIAFKNEDGAWLAKCFKCGHGFDNISLLAAHYSLNTRADFGEILKRSAADFGIATDIDFHKPQKFSAYHNLTPIKIEKLAQDSNKIEVEKLTEKYIKQVLTLPDNLEKLSEGNRRGLTVETLRHFKCIYVEKWIHPKIFAEYKFGLRDESRLPPRTRRILIPTADGLHYNAVLVDSDRPQFPSDKWKMHAGKKSVPFGINTIKSEGAGEIITFTDKELDNVTLENRDEEPLGFLKFTCKIFGVNSAEKISDNEDWAELAEICNGVEIKYVIIVEGEFDAMSAWQAVHKKNPALAFIATGGITERKWIKAVDAKCKELKISPLFVIMFDNGEREKENAESCAKELKKLGYPATVKLMKG